MTKNGLDIQTISTKRTGFQTDRVLLMGQVKEKHEKVDPTIILKFPLAKLHCTHLVLPETQADNSQKQKRATFSNTPIKKIL
jgi:hypothetical protein